MVTTVPVLYSIMYHALKNNVKEKVLDYQSMPDVQCYNTITKHEIDLSSVGLQ